MADHTTSCCEEALIASVVTLLHECNCDEHLVRELVSRAVEEAAQRVSLEQVAIEEEYLHELPPQE